MGEATPPWRPPRASVSRRGIVSADGFHGASGVRGLRFLPVCVMGVRQPGALSPYASYSCGRYVSVFSPSVPVHRHANPAPHAVAGGNKPSIGIEWGSWRINPFHSCHAIMFPSTIVLVFSCILRDCARPFSLWRLRREPFHCCRTPGRFHSRGCYDARGRLPFLSYSMRVVGISAAPSRVCLPQASFSSADST